MFHCFKASRKRLYCLMSQCCCWEVWCPVVLIDYLFFQETIWRFSFVLGILQFHYNIDSYIFLFSYMPSCSAFTPGSFRIFIKVLDTCLQSFFITSSSAYFMFSPTDFFSVSSFALLSFSVVPSVTQGGGGDGGGASSSSSFFS